MSLIWCLFTYVFLSFPSPRVVQTRQWRSISILPAWYFGIGRLLSVQLVLVFQKGAYLKGPGLCLSFDFRVTQDFDGAMFFPKNTIKAQAWSKRTIYCRWQPNLNGESRRN